MSEDYVKESFRKRGRVLTEKTSTCAVWSKSIFCMQISILKHIEIDAYLLKVLEKAEFLERLFP